MTSYIFSFDTINTESLLEVGGKGANLGELTQAGFNVPAGFCVSTHAFRAFMALAVEDMYARLDTVTADDLEQLRQTGRYVRDYLDDVPLPTAVGEAIIDAWGAFGEEEAYAVRSSATAEDLPHASFAGQQDTYLNICGKGALLAAVKACFISLFTDRAILYRVQNRFAHRQVALSVVVQRMVQPDVAGILFTADPVTGNRHIVSIDASFGLGEALVAGLVSADLYQVDKRDNQIIKRQIAKKQLAIRSLVGGGTEQIALTESESTQAALSDTQILRLAQLGSQIEAHYGTPQDVEWALANGRFYITQSRPITSLYPLPQPRPEDECLHVYVSFSHFQVMTDAMTPLVLSIWRTLLPIGHREGQRESPYSHTAGGRLYGDISPVLRHPVGRHILPRLFKHADPLVVGALKALAQRADFQAEGEQIRLWPLLPRTLPFLRKLLHTLFMRPPEGMTSKVLHLMDEHILGIKAQLNKAPDVQKKLAHILFEMKHIFAVIFSWAPYLVAGLMARVLLSVLFRNGRGKELLTALERGLAGNVTTEMDLAVGDLSDAACTTEVLRAYLRQTEIDAQTRLAGVGDLPGGAAFLQAWHHFIEMYGVRGPSEIDLHRPRWSEDPTSLLQMVVNGLTYSEVGAHRVHYQKLATEGERAANRLITLAHSGWSGWWRGPLTRRLVRVSRNLLPLREHHKFFVIKLLALVKPVLLEIGEQFVAEGKLASTEDIWFLTLSEMIMALDKPEPHLQPLVSKRRSAFAHYQNLTPPRLLTSDGEIPITKLEGVEAPEGALVGSPVSAGVVEGIAKVVLDPSHEMLAPGEILVAPFTDPGWTPLFVNAAGLITEVGGLMTHGSLVAREYGIPAIVGVVDATKHIKTGQRIRVHGDSGYVEWVEKNGRVSEAVSS